MEGDAQVAADLNQAIRDALGKHGIVAIRHVVIVEGLDPEDSERALWTNTSEGLTRWDSAGMLTYALHMEQAATLRDEDS